MSNKEFSLTLRGVKTKFPSALEVFLRTKKPKKITLITFTLGADCVAYLNRLHGEGRMVRVGYHKLVECVSKDIKFVSRSLPTNHSKIWHIDDDIFVGSANLTGDTIGNVMIRVKDVEQHKRLLSYISSCFVGANKPETLFIF